MEFTGTKSFRLDVVRTSQFVDDKLISGYKSSIRNRASDGIIMTVFSPSFDMCTRHSNRICNDLELEREQIKDVRQPPQLRLIE